MKILSLRLAILGVLLYHAAGISFAADPIGKITFVIGGVLLKHDGSTTWTKPVIGTPVNNKDALSTETEAKCEVTLNENKVVRMDEKSMIVINEDNEDNTVIKTTHASIWTNVKKLVKTRNFQVATPTATAAIRGTTFSVNCNTNKSDYLVFKGTVAVSSGKTTGKDSLVQVTNGERFTLVKDMKSYLKDEEKAFKDFMAKDLEDFQNFQKKDQEDMAKFQNDQEKALQEMLTNEQSSFSKSGELNVAKRKIDMKYTAKSAWAQWNMERDKTVGW